MKTMRRETLLKMIVIGVMIVFVPIVALADQVPWSTQSYRASADEFWGSSDEKFGPPLPLSASVYGTCGSAYAYASSDITSTSMIVSTGGRKSGNLCVNDSYAEAEFEGTYTANNSFFIFYYNYSVAGSGPGFYDASGSLYIENVSSSTVLFDQSLGWSDITDTLNVHTPIGDEILVRMKVNSATCCDGDGTVTLNYNMSTSVVPEPISSILFVTGGALLAGKRYLKRRKT